MKNDRSKIIVRSGFLFILVNFLLAAFNLVVGIISNSLAIISDSAHSLIDAVSGIIIIGSEKLARSHKFTDKRVKIERITTIIIAFIIIAVGIHIVIEAIEKLIDPEEVEYPLPVIIILIVSILAKYALAFYLKRQGQKYDSNVLTASSAETMTDTLISVAILISAFIYLIWQIDLESYLSIFISIIIFKVGLEFIFPHLSTHHHHPFDKHPDHDHCGKK